MTFSEEIRTKLRSMLLRIVSAKPSFYREHYARHSYGGEIESLSDFTRIPPIQWGDIVSTSLQGRLYVSENIFVKVVYKKGEGALVARTRRDIEEEEFGPVGERPLVLFSRSHENTEKGLWCYGQNVLPLVREPGIPLTATIAQQYGIDSILGETKEINALLPELAKVYPLEEVKSVSIIDHHFDVGPIESLCPNTTLSIRLALPETGVLAEGEFGERGELRFTPARDVLLEVEEEELIATKLGLLPTPLIRYRTGIRAEEDRDKFRLLEK